MDRTIPAMMNPESLFHAGPNSSLASQSLPSHPASRASATHEGTDFDQVKRIYGTGLAMRMQAERSYASQCGGRLPGMDGTPASNALLNSLTGDDTMIDFSDVLNQPATRPVAPKVVLHQAMEIRLGL